MFKRLLSLEPHRFPPLSCIIIILDFPPHVLLMQLLLCRST